ncbi:MAG: trehalose-phosphatase [Acidiferrobacteraceae bacterium]
MSMRILDHRLDLSGFFLRVAQTPSRVLLLDYDGTLAPFAKDPRDARPYPCVVPIIQRLIDARSTRIVFVSGRRIDDLKPLLPFAPIPEIWGSHGYEHLSADGTRRTFTPGPESIRCLALIRERLARELPEIRSEVKIAGVALHWRDEPPARIAQMRRQGSAIWRAATPHGAVVMQEFDGGIEFKARDRTKGSAVSAVMAGTGIGAYLGDDLTDEDAFAVMSRAGISVLVRDRFRNTSASIWISPPEELEALLLDWEAACAGGAATRLAALQVTEPRGIARWT